MIGQNATGAAFTATTASPTFALGTRMLGASGAEYVYVQASGAIASAGQAVFISEAYQAALLSTSNDDFGDNVGIAPAAFANDEYGWVQIFGPCVIQVAASCAANALLMTTSTGGHLDDTATGVSVVGAILTATRAASAGTAAGYLRYPSIGATVA